jgi:hypothetical protein
MKTQIACAGTAYRDDNGQAVDRGYKYGDVTTPFGSGRVTAHINGGFTIELCGILINGCHIEIIKEPSLAIDPKRAIPHGEVSILNRPWQYYAENVGAFDGVAEITINDAAMEVFPVAIEVKKAAGCGGEVLVWRERVSWISHTNFYTYPEEWRAFNARCEEAATKAFHDRQSTSTGGEECQEGLLSETQQEEGARMKV